jgi:hypothetical protein
MRMFALVVLAGTLLSTAAHAQGIDGYGNGRPTIYTSPQTLSPTYAPQIYQPRQPSYGSGNTLPPTYTPPGLQPPRPSSGIGTMRRTPPLDDDD